MADTGLLGTPDSVLGSSLLLGEGAATNTAAPITVVVGPITPGFQAVTPVTVLAGGVAGCDLTNSLDITVGCILAHLFTQAGLTASQFNVSDVDTSAYLVKGFIVDERTSPLDAIEELLRVYDVDLVSVDGKITAKARGGGVYATIPSDDLGAHLYSGNEVAETVVTRRTMDLELPRDVDLSYWSEANNYQQANQRAQRYTLGHTDLLTITVPVVLTDNLARQAAERILYRLWREREQFQFTLLPQWLVLTPGDVLTVPVLGIATRMRVLSVGVSFFGPVEVQAVLDDVAVITQEQAGAATPVSAAELKTATTTTLIAWSTNALRDADAASVGFYYGALGPAGTDWPGCVVYLSQDGGANYSPVDETADATSYGTANTVLAAGTTTGLFDTVNTVDVTMTSGVPVSSTDSAVLNGANAAMLGDEMIQFVTVTPLGGSSYRLSRLLRGRRATNNSWGTHAVAERFVLLDNGGSTRRVTVGEELIGKVVQLKAVTEGQSLASATAVPLTITGNEYKSYDGTDGQGTRHVPAANDWTVAWKRRTRCGGAWADLTEAALCEDTEAYEAEIWDSGYTTLKRTFTGLTTPTFVYTAAQQTTDFGGIQTSVFVRVYQLGRVGRGYAYSLSLSG